MPSTPCRLDLCILYMEKAHKHVWMERNTQIQIHGHTQTCSPSSRPWTSGHWSHSYSFKKGISISKSHANKWNADVNTLGANKPPPPQSPPRPSTGFPSLCTKQAENVHNFLRHAEIPRQYAPGALGDPALFCFSLALSLAH